MLLLQRQQLGELALKILNLGCSSRNLGEEIGKSLLYAIGAGREVFLEGVGIGRKKRCGEGCGFFTKALDHV